MSVSNILADLRQRNITVRARGNDLSVVAENGALSPELRAVLAAHKHEIVRYLRQLEDSGAAETIPVVPRGEGLPLSFGQRRLWFLAQLDPGSSAYTIPAAVRVEGHLEAATLLQALEHVVQRHEVLRTVFVNPGGDPCQVILERMDVPFSEVDLRQYSVGEREARLAHLIREDLCKPFDLAEGPLMRAVLVQLAEREQVLLLSLHHIVADGWSIGILVRELSAFYDGARSGHRVELNPLPVQYADYAAWQRQWSAGPVRERQLQYWRKQLADIEPLRLPTDHPRRERGTPPGASAWFVIPATLAERLNSLAREEDATLFMVLLAAFQGLLGRYTGQMEIAVGTPVANRERKQIEGLIGFFVNTVVMLADLKGSPGFRPLLKQVRETALGAFENQELPFEQLVDDLLPERDLNQNPLFQVMFMIQNVPRAGLHLTEVTLRPLNIESPAAKFDLTMGLSEEDEGLQGWLSYNADLFEPATIARLIEHYSVLLDGMIAQPERSIAQLPLLAEGERRQLTEEWNATAAVYSCKPVHELFAEQAARTPGAVAVRYQGSVLSYADLECRANRLARYLQKFGAGPDVRIGICIERSLEMVVAVLGVLKAGAGYVPLDPGYPAERLAFMVEQTQMPVILVLEKLKIEFAGHAKKIEIDTEWPAIEMESDARPEVEIQPDNLAYVMFTSGSTGRPKGVMVTHRGLSNYLNWAIENYPVSLGEGSPLHTSMSFDLSVTSLLPSLLVGQSVLAMKEGGGEELQQLAELLQSGPPLSLVKATPSHLHVFREMLSERHEVVSPGAFVIGGEAVFHEDVRWWKEHTPATRLINEYGPTEAVVGCCVFEIGSGNESSGPVPIGRPIANTRLYVVDREGELTPIGVPGELFIGGAGLARGYVNRADLTAERFVPDAMSETAGARLYRTGDKARWRADGNLEYFGRMDDQVKVRGHRIELGEIEAVLLQHGAVNQAVVVVHEDLPQENRPREKHLAAYFVRNGEGEKTGVGALREYLSSRLPEYMVPGAIVEIEKLPLTPNGKVDRRALPKPDYQAAEEHAGPRNASEEILCGIIAEVLKLQKVGIRQNFFQAGGHSLLATQVISRVRAVLGVDLPLRAIFESPTVAGLAERVERARAAGAETVPPLARAMRDQAIPLSFAQQRLWFLDQFEPNTATYNSSVALRLEGELSVDALVRALSEIVRRHETLRTHMEVFQGEARQVIDAPAVAALPVVDLSSQSPEDREAKTEKAAREEAEAPFNLARGPLLRFRLLRRERHEHVLLMTVHHIVSDGWSVGIMVRELSELYRAGVLGQPSPLPELTFQYADYAVWQRRWLQGSILEQQITYWKNQLAEVPMLEIPTDSPHSPVANPQGASVKWGLSADLTGMLKELSRREGVTLFMTLLAAFQLLLSRYSGQTDIAVGSPIAGRTRTEFEGLIGFFVNTLVLRTELGGQPTFRELLARVREMTLSAYAHQDVPFEKLVGELQPDRNLSRSPLFQAMFMLQNTPSTGWELPGLKLSVMDRTAETVHFELLLSAFEEDDRINGGLSYRSALFGRRRILRMLDHWRNLLASIVAGPQKRIGELEIMSEAERRMVVVEWNRTEAPYPRRWIHEMVEDHARKTPAATAVEFEGRRLSYGELNERANQLAHHLKRLGAKPDALVGICVERSPEMGVGVLAILKTGSAYVPLDPKYPASRLSYMLENAQIDLLVTSEQYRGLFADSGRSTVCIDAGWANLEMESKLNLNTGVEGGNVAFVIYTSGSTGWPKGVAMGHEAVANLIQWHLRRDPEPVPPVTLQFASLSFDVSFQDLFVTWCAGGRLVLIGEEARLDPAELWRVICDRGVTRISLPFVALQQLAEAAVRKQPESCSLRELITAGEQLRVTPALQKLLRLLPNCRLENQYGPTEGHVVTLYRLDEDPEGWAFLPPIGKPVENTQVYLLNDEGLPVPWGIVGEMYLGGRQLSRGYVNRPELTAERFVPNPFSGVPGERLYKTGDLARWQEDGNVEYLGRADQQFKIRGYRIELGEVESTLSECEGVRQAAVAIREDQLGEKRLVGYVVGEPGVQLSEQKLRSDVSLRLPEFMVPSVFMVLTELPLTPSGKVDRKRLPDPGGSGGVEGREEEDYLAPANEIEEVLCRIWEELLHRERIGVTRNFFEAGGHSLLATQVMARIGDALGVELPVRRLFELPTIAQLAREIMQLSSANGEVRAMPIVKASRRRAVPVSFAQQRLWFLDQLQPGTPTYNLAAALRLGGALRLDAVDYAFRELIARHETLRTTFRAQEGEPVQVIGPAVEFSTPLLDLSGLPGEAAEAEARRLAEEEAARPFDLSRGPLLRAKLVRLSDRAHVLLVTMHHIISDGWSMGIMVREFGRLYEARCKGEEPALPELPIQYADFSIWQRAWLEGAVLDKQLRYWKLRLAGVTPMDLPLDRPRPAVMGHEGSSMPFSLVAGQVEPLARLGRRQGATLYMTLLAAFYALLHRYSGQSDIAVGSPIAGRRRTETEGLIGFFINTLVMRTEVPGTVNFTELLQRVRETTLEAYTHQDVPFEKVVEEVQPERDQSRTPLFQVVFMLQNTPRVEMQLGEIRLSPFAVDDRTAKFDLTISLSEDDEQLRGWAGYNTEILGRATVSRMIGHYHRMLAAIAEHPDHPIAELPLLSEAERQQLVVDWNDTSAAFAGEFVHELFERQAAETPSAPAVDYEDGRLTYEQLNRRANQLARRLRKLGAGQEVLVGVCMERSLELVIALMGILKAGAAYVPLDPGYPEDRLRFMMKEARMPVILLQKKLVTDFPQPPATLLAVDEQWADIAGERNDNLDIHVHPEGLAYVIYTSGSTGRPKGAMNTHRGLRNRLAWMQEQYRLGPDDRVLQKTPYSFDVSVWEFFWPLMVGAELVVAKPGGHRDPQYLGELIREKQVSTLHFVPSMLAAFLEAGGDKQCASVRRVICSGEALGPELARRCLERINAELHNLYGPTEASIDVTWWQCEPGELAGGVPIGRPIANTEIYILDSVGRPCPILVSGELYIGGAGLARGYVNRPDLTAERFVPGAVSTQAGERLYRTGDKARWRADGNIEYLGRLDDQVKIRGHRIELGEIESTLRQSPAVNDVVVVARESGEGDRRLVSYIIPDEESAAAVRTLARYRDQGLLERYVVEDLPNGFPVLAKNKSEARFLYQEIFEEDFCAHHNITLGDQDCVLDVGANIGMFSLYIAQQCGNPRIYAFEPIPELCALVRLNFGLWGLDARVFDCGLSNASGRESFVYYPHVTILSGSSADPAEEKKVLLAYELNKFGEAGPAESRSLNELIETRLTSERIDCEVKTISQVIRENPGSLDTIDLLKIDVEKSERRVLAGIEEEHWPRIRQVVVEVHDIDGGLNWTVELLETHGYSVAVEQESALRDTGLFVIYAVRPAQTHRPLATAGAGVATQARFSPSRLETELRRSLELKLADYMVPSSFVFMDRFPLLPSGKLDRKALPSPENSITGKRGAVYAPPQTAIEKQLAQIFSEILRKDRIGLHDDFFDLGGHSLLMFRLRTMIEERLDRALSLSSLFTAPTVAGLAHLLEVPSPASPASILVPLQATGSRPPFFCVHPVGGQVLCYVSLSRELGPEQPFYALQSPDPGQSPALTVEEMAGLYIREIQRVQPHGPYLLGGWSMGGLVAFEMAHQLIEHGERIGLLALMDTVPDSLNSGEDGGSSSFSMLERLALDVGRTVLRNPEELREIFLQLTPPEQMRLMLEVLVREGIFPQGSGQAELNRLLEIFTRNSQAMENYRLRVLNQRIALFPAAGRESSEMLATTWERWTSAGVEVQAVPGDHYTMLKPPCVAAIASRLGLYLETEPDAVVLS